jgi:tRNA threonylcarbamoyladenosine biosynthesis protein TsaB
LRPEPVILAFDTSAAHCAAALLMGDRIVSAREEPMMTGQAERLLPLLEEMLAAVRLTWTDLSAIAVGTGPGNFTGIRIAVSAARGLALALGIPAIGVSRLEALAYGLPRPATVRLDAKRGQVYAQDFPDGTPELRAADGPLSEAPVPLAEAITRIAATRLQGHHDRPAPLYIREADAAPSKITAPRISS